eukprot:SAG22_NODE_18061_length_294_cov_0.758974_1_plen_86_part_10
MQGRGPGACSGCMHFREGCQARGLRESVCLPLPRCPQNCAEFPFEECEANTRWMYANCEAKCRRCVDHMQFVHGPAVTHMKGKKAI